MKTTSATISDAAVIAGIHVASWRAAFRGLVPDTFLDAMSMEDRAARWRHNLQDSACSILLASEGEQVLGFASFGRCRDKDAPPDEGEIWTMYVDPSAWRRAVGATLMRAALNRLAERGLRPVRVWVMAKNTRAIAFYQAHGFEAAVPGSRFFQLGGRQIEEISLACAR